MKITKIIESRKSCRTYQKKFLSLEDKRTLETIISEAKGLGDHPVPFQILENREFNKEMKLNYGGIKGHNTYLLGTSKSSPENRVDYGYQAEIILLKATALGLDSCWIGYFDKDFFSHIEIPQGYEIPSLIIFGYGDPNPSGADRFARFAIGASKRQPFDKLFFDYHSKKSLDLNQSGPYLQPLEMVRLAPSSGNTQPWRIFWDSELKEYHFFKKVINKKYEEKGVHDIDMGIALAHFELTAQESRLSGHWISKDPDSLEGMAPLQYCITWKVE